MDFVPGRRGGSKDKEEHERIRAAGPDGGVWRAEDHSSCSNTYTGIDGDAEEDDGRGVARGGMREEDAGPAWEIVEGGDVVLDLGEFRRAAVPAKKIPQPRQGVAGGRSPVGVLSPEAGNGDGGGGYGGGGGGAGENSTWSSMQRMPEELDSRPRRSELDGGGGGGGGRGRRWSQRALQRPEQRFV